MSAEDQEQPGSSTVAERPGRGRPRQFDEDAVVDAVMQLFWSKGYEATSVSDIVEATGLSKSSLYNAFGSKESLFVMALQSYVLERCQLIESILAGGEDGLDDLHRLFRGLRDDLLTDPERRGCFYVNSATELGLRDAQVARLSKVFRTEFRASADAVLGRAVALGEVDEALCEVYAETMLTYILSVSVVARSGASDDEVDAQFDAVHVLIDSWRAAAPAPVA